VRFGNAGQVLERRNLGGVLYAAQRSLRPGARAGRVHWVATPLQRGARASFPSEGDAFTDLPSVPRALSGIRARVRRIGRESVSRVPATRYHLLTDLASFLRPSADHIQNPLAYRRVKAVLDVWIDARGRPLRVDETFTGPSSSGRTIMTTVVRFTDYEHAVSVLAPARSVIGSRRAIAPPNPLSAGPGSPLARRLFFRAPAR
jgi:hypothetical protein